MRYWVITMQAGAVKKGDLTSLMHGMDVSTVTINWYAMAT